MIARHKYQILFWLCIAATIIASLMPRRGKALVSDAGQSFPCRYLRAAILFLCARLQQSISTLAAGAGAGMLWSEHGVCPVPDQLQAGRGLGSVGQFKRYTAGLATYALASEGNMIEVYRGSDFFEGQLLKGLMEQDGLQVFLNGTALQGGLGEVPALGHLSITVNDADRERAEEIIAAYERGDFALEDED